SDALRIGTVRPVKYRVRGRHPLSVRPGAVIAAHTGRDLPLSLPEHQYREAQQVARTTLPPPKVEVTLGPATPAIPFHPHKGCGKNRAGGRARAPASASWVDGALRSAGGHILTGA